MCSTYVKDYHLNNDTLFFQLQYLICHVKKKTIKNTNPYVIKNVYLTFCKKKQTKKKTKKKTKNLLLLSFAEL